MSRVPVVAIGATGSRISGISWAGISSLPTPSFEKLAEGNLVGTPRRSSPAPAYPVRENGNPVMRNAVGVEDDEPG